jgi:hypothetical protein
LASLQRRPRCAAGAGPARQPGSQAGAG